LDSDELRSDKITAKKRHRGAGWCSSVFTDSGRKYYVYIRLNLHLNVFSVSRRADDRLFHMDP